MDLDNVPAKQEIVMGVGVIPCNDFLSFSASTGVFYQIKFYFRWLVIVGIIH